jgi:hypothetical protein
MNRRDLHLVCTVTNLVGWSRYCFGVISGQIQVDSELGKGTVFTVILPNATSIDIR